MPSTRRLAAILAADVAGYSRLMGADEEGTHERLKAHIGHIVEPKIKEHGGRTVKNTGDGFLSEFTSVVDAVRCAVEIQRGMMERERDVPDERRIAFRIGINVGDVIIEEHDIFGDGVNVAARLEALAEPGGICVSDRVQSDAVGRIDIGFDDLGPQQVKNIARPVHVHRVRLDKSGVKAALPLPKKPSIAVLPFQNMSGDPEQEYFADGMVEEIITALSRIRWLFVIARSSSFTYKGQAVDVRQVGRELGVRYVLEGSVRKVRDHVRITSHLVDTTTASHIWADSFDSTLNDIFDLQDRIASRIIGIIEPKLLRSEIEQAERKPTEILDAYDLYLRALALRYTYKSEHIEDAIHMLKRALTIDPHYFRAAALIGWFRIHKEWICIGSVSDIEKAESLQLATMTIDNGGNDPDALWMAAYTISVFGGEHERAHSAIERALILNPNCAHAWMACGSVCIYEGRANEAIDAFHRAMLLSPLDPWSPGIKSGIALAHLIAGRHEQALQWAEKSLLERADYRIALRIKTASYAHAGKIEEARYWGTRLLAVDPTFTIAAYERYAKRLYPPDVISFMIEGWRAAKIPER